METIFESLQVIRNYNDNQPTPENLHHFEWNLINEEFNKNDRFKSNAARSSSIETGLEYAWSCLTSEEPPTVTKVRNNPNINTSSGSRRPDVYIEFHGNLGAEFRRVVEFQVKAYSSNGVVRLDHIESSLELFNEQHTDFIYFIITGNGLDQNAEKIVKQLENQYPTRIRRPVLTKKQENHLYYLALYSEIVGKKLGENFDDIYIAKSALSGIIGQPINHFILEIKNLAYRKALIDLEEESTPSIEHKKEISKSKLETSGLNSFINEEKPISQVSEDSSNRFKWLENYSEFEKYKYELCALCLYLKNRETGRYKFKFTTNTVLKNVINSDVGLDKSLFKQLIDCLQDKNCIEKEKSSYNLTDLGKKLYFDIKKEKYQC